MKIWQEFVWRSKQRKNILPLARRRIVLFVKKNWVGPIWKFKSFEDLEKISIQSRSGYHRMKKTSCASLRLILWMAIQKLLSSTLKIYWQEEAALLNSSILIRFNTGTTKHRLLMLNKQVRRSLQQRAKHKCTFTFNPICIHVFKVQKRRSNNWSKVTIIVAEHNRTLTTTWLVESLKSPLKTWMKNCKWLSRSFRRSTKLAINLWNPYLKRDYNIL